MKFYKIKNWRFVLGVLIFCFLSTYYIIHTSYSLAADAIPAPGRVPCTTNDNPEFSSDRPYQASPCGDRPITYWCGNSVVIDLGSVSCDPPYIGAPSCSYNRTIDKTVDVDLTNVQLPILGDTQDTLNSQNTTDNIDDGTKVSNYVSWYLNGTNDKAEYASTDPSTSQGQSQIVDTSGPLKKLLPSVVQDAARIGSITQASTNVTYTPDNSDTSQTASSQSVTEPQNHNQIVVCGKSDSPFAIPQWLSNLIGIGQIGKVSGTPCYPTSGNPARNEYRLNDWNGSSNIQNAINFADKYLVPFFPGISQILQYTDVAQRWSKNTPPLPWDDGTGKAFATQEAYQKAYNEWRGQICAYVPNITNITQKLLICTGDLLPVTNPYADLFPYVPLANTTDKKGVHMVTSFVLRAPKATITSSVYNIINSPALWLSHSLENFDLTSLLKSTYAPKTNDKNTNSTAPNDVENFGGTCSILNSRTNQGDDATFSNPQSHIKITTSYTVGDIQCDPPRRVCTGSLQRGNYGCHWVQTCQSEVYATIPSVSKTPYADEIFQNTVAGNDSAFRRIYPKTGANAPVSCIADNPAASNVTYTLNSGSSPGEAITRVIEPDGSAVGTGGKGASSLDAQLYYPHYGSVFDYFLQGIQQALRPQGYGTGTPVNGQFCSNLQCGELPKNLPKGAGSCSLGGTSGLNVPNSFRQILEAAGQTYNVPPSLILGVMYGEGAFNPGRYAWTDTNVKNWASCQKIPNCSPSGSPINSVVPYIPVYWNDVAKQILPDLQKLDPTKKQADPCNILDVTYGLAKDLSTGKYGGSFGGLNSCFGIPLNTGSSATSGCAWNTSDYETAIKVWENGYDPGCFTKENSCATGGGNNALCPTGGDTCETINNRYPASQPSHNACVFDIATGGSSGSKQ